MNTVKNIRNNLLFLIIPTILIVTILHLRISKGPFWVKSDPSYIYALNGSNLAIFTTPGHIDHPGTTLQIIIGLTVRIANHFNSKDIVISNILKHTETYLWIVYILLLMALFLIVYTCAISISEIFNNKAYAYLFQLSFLLFPDMLLSLLDVWPETLLVSIIVPLSVILINEFYTKKIPFNSRKYKTIGILSGAAFATKITIIPIFLPLFILFKGLKNRCYLLLFTILGFLIFTTPIIQKYKNIYHWIYALITHDGFYGGGKANVVDPKVYLESILKIISNHDIQFTIFFCVLTLIFTLISKNKEKIKLPIYLLFSTFLSIIFVAKAFRVHYLIPLISLAPIIILTTYINLKKFKHIKILSIIFGLIIASKLYHSYYNVFKYAKELDRYKQDIMKINKFVKQDKSCTTIYFYEASSYNAALMFGNEWARLKYTTYLDSVKSNALFYWGGAFLKYGKDFSRNFKPNLKNKCYILYGSDSGSEIGLFEYKFKKYFSIKESYIYRNFYSMPGKALYRLDTNGAALK